jgi:hypothetical protein
LYQSDTGQMLIDKKSGRFSVVTPRTEAMTSNVAVTTGVNLSALKVAKLSSSGMVAASSLDDVNVAASKKVLVVYATDAENTGMTFSDSSRKTLATLGKVPVRVQNGTATLTVALAHTTNMKLSALTLNGERGAEVVMTKVANAAKGYDWSFTLDTAKTPTTFFVLEPR